MLAAVENVAFVDGLWWSFAVVSTTGFEGPASDAGRLLGIGLFAWALLSYLALLAGTFHHAVSQLDRRSPPTRQTVLTERDVRRIAESIHLN